MINTSETFKKKALRMIFLIILLLKNTLYSKIKQLLLDFIKGFTRKETEVEISYDTEIVYKPAKVYLISTFQGVLKAIYGMLEENKLENLLK